MKRPDPHEEALLILKGQMSHVATAPGMQVRGSLAVPRQNGKQWGLQGASETRCP